ncbi:hypothetical protein FJZ31_36900 [Candidatus Poribacteria bacterium]|nr:hypothetical protein [Candidatus Poribacteria bacterium]
MEALEEIDRRNQRGLDLDLPAIIDLLGKEKVIEAIGLDNMIETARREKVREIILPNLTKEQIKKLIEQNGNKCATFSFLKKKLEEKFG